MAQSEGPTPDTTPRRREGREGRGGEGEKEGWNDKRELGRIHAEPLGLTKIQE